MRMPSFQGIFTALVTPFTKTQEIDWIAWENLLRNQLEAGVHGVVLAATTGESATLTKEEKKELIQRTIAFFKKNPSNLQIIASTGSNNTEETLEFSAWASEQGVDALLLVTPYYNRPSQTGLKNHFLQVANHVRCPIILYQVPLRTGVELEPKTIASLAEHPRIQGLKDASGRLTLISEVLERVPLFKMLIGDDFHFLPAWALGCSGVVSVASNLIPKSMVKWHRMLLEGQFSEALKIHNRFYPLFRDLFIESNPAPVKAGLHTLGWCEKILRPPLAQLSESHEHQLQLTLKKCAITPGELL